MSIPAKCISVAKGKELQKNWMDTRAKDIENAEGFEDTCEFVYTVAELQEFLDYVKKQANLAGFDNPGVRIYFAAYDDATSNKATVLLAPTESGSPTANNIYTIQPLNNSHGGMPPKKYI